MTFVLRTTVFALFAVWVSACADPAPAPEEESPALAGPGEACSPESACEAWLLCVDGACREVPWPGPTPPPDDPPLVAQPDVPEPPEKDADGGDAALDSEVADDVGPEDAVPPGDTKPTPDAAPEDTTEEDAADASDDIADGDEDTDAPNDAAPEDATAEDTPDSADAADAGPEPPTVVVLYVSADEAASNPGTQFLSLVSGQGWVAELVLPKSGKVIAMEVIVDNIYNDSSCGRFRPMVWSPEGDGTWAFDPVWSASDLQTLVGNPAPQTFLLSDPPEMEEGPIRVGLVYEEKCDGDPPIPWLFTDGSGDLGDTWLWSSLAESNPWVPGSFLGVEGRWALRLLLQVEVAPGG